jgi:uncharacterized protein YukE
MAIDDLPGPVVNFLNVIGVEWPYINEDSLHEFGSVVREFGQAVQNTHQDATNTVKAMGESWKGAAYDKLNDRWTRMSSAHVNDIVDGCSVLADACDVAAGYIVGQKIEAIAQLVEMAVEFFADQAAAIATAGIAEAALPAIIEGGQLVAKSLVQDLEQYLIGQLAGMAVKPLLAKVESALAGLDWPSGTGSGEGGSAAEMFEVDIPTMRGHSATLAGHAATMRQHTETFKTKAAAIQF